MKARSETFKWHCAIVDVWMMVDKIYWQSQMWYQESFQSGKWDIRKKWDRDLVLKVETRWHNSRAWKEAVCEDGRRTLHFLQSCFRERVWPASSSGTRGWTSFWRRAKSPKCKENNNNLLMFTKHSVFNAIQKCWIVQIKSNRIFKYCWRKWY